MSLPSIVYWSQAISILRKNGYAPDARTNLHIDGKFMPVREYKSSRHRDTFLVGRRYSAVTGSNRNDGDDRQGVMTTEELLKYLKERFSSRPA
jgi:hypothetical protein